MPSFKERLNARQITKSPVLDVRARLALTRASESPEELEFGLQQSQRSVWGRVITSEVPTVTVGPGVCTLVMPEYRCCL